MGAGDPNSGLSAQVLSILYPLNHLPRPCILLSIFQDYIWFQATESLTRGLKHEGVFFFFLHSRNSNTLLLLALLSVIFSSRLQMVAVPLASGAELQQPPVSPFFMKAQILLAPKALLSVVRLGVPFFLAGTILYDRLQLQRRESQHLVHTVVGDSTRAVSQVMVVE